MENLDPPSPPNQGWEMARFCPSRAFILDLGGGWGFAVPFYFVQDCRSLDTRCLTKDICRMGVVDGLFSYAEDMTVERSFMRQSSDPESLWNHIRVLTKVEGSFFYSAIFVK